MTNVENDRICQKKKLTDNTKCNHPLGKGHGYG